MNNQKNYKFKKIILFGDIIGIPRLLKHLDNNLVVAIVGASVRPQYHNELKKLANQLNVPYIIQPKFKSSEYRNFVNNISKLTPNLLLCFSYSMLIRKDVLEIFNYNCINIHGSLLPKNRGPNSTQWAILHNENKVGITIHYMGLGFDDGDIIDQEYRLISFCEDRETINNDLNELGELLLKNNIFKILKGKNKRYKQNEEKATFTKRLTKDSAKIDLFQMSSIEIYNWIRTQVKPYLGAFILKDNGIKTYFNEMLSLVDIFKLKFDTIGSDLYKSKELHLAPLEMNDLQRLFNLLDDKELIHFNLKYKPINNNNHKWFNNIISIDNAVILGIKKNKNGQLTGCIQLHSLDPISQRAELNITINNKETGQIKVNLRESINLLLKYAKKDLNLKKVYLYVFNDDKIKINILKKLKFKEVGILKKHTLIDNKWKNEIIMERFL